MTDERRQPAPCDFAAINYPFADGGRAGSRLLFDFSLALACFHPDPPNRKVLDFACGTGWTSEWLNKLGYDVYGFDIDEAAIDSGRKRAELDVRIDPARLHFSIANRHRIEFPHETFGHILCFDSLHHMADYEKVFQEMYRVLCSGGRAIFVEPGSRHSRSPETIQFLQNHPKGEDWLEKDVNLRDMFDLANRVGFVDFKVKPFLLPTMVEFSFVDWYHILDNPEGIQNYMRELRRLAWEDRVVFFMTRT